MRSLAWGAALGALGAGVWALISAPALLHRWWVTAFGEELRRWLPLAPLLPLALTASWGWHLQQARAVWLALTLAAVHLCASLTLPSEFPAERLRTAVGLGLPWAFPLLLHSPESGLTTRWGWVRPLGMLSLLAGGYLWASLGGALPPALSHKLRLLPGGLTTLFSGLSVLLLWAIPSRGARELRKSWALALAAVGIGLLEAEPWWQGEVQGAIWPIFLSFSSAFLVSGLYGLTWRRAYLDELTGVPGRRAFEEAVRRLGRRYAIAMLDVDHFKRINDRYGHPVGDQVLRFIASRLQRLPFGQAYRYGGEEFALIMRGKRAEGALALMEDLRQSIEGSTLTLRGKDRPDRKPGRRDRPAGGRSALRFTVSIGLAQRDRTHATPQAVLKAADEALYRAKRAGRNRVEWERRKSRR